jgi:hypothetical protein
MACKCSKMAKRKKTYRRRRSRSRIGQVSAKGFTDLAMTGLGVGAGMALARMLANNIGFLRQNRLFGALAQVGGGLVVAGMGGNIGKNLAAGMAAEAVVSTVVELAPGVASTVGLSGLGSVFPGSSNIPGVAGKYAVGQNPVVRVQ